MAADVKALLDDLNAETTLLVEVLVRADGQDWSHPTPAEGWTVRDQITHLAYFDQAATEAAADPVAFDLGRAEAIRDVDGFTERIANQFSGMEGAEALAWFRRARDGLIVVYAQIDPTVRIPWYGPDMSPASAVTARIMETWAHGQDILDALGVPRRESPGLRHVAHLGVRTLAHSFRSHGRPVPESPVRVELLAPDGEVWTWGPTGTPDEVRGPAVDFCQVVTQRRHPNDTELVGRGPVAEEWLAVAQAFAGPPGRGRQPGQFSGGRRPKPTDAS